MLAPSFRYTVALVSALLSSHLLHSFSNITRNDPAPLFSARYPYDFLTTGWREYQKGNSDCLQEQHLSISVSPFRESAKNGKNINKNWCELGDLQGPWNLFGVFYDPAPCNAVLHDLGLTVADLSAIANDGSTYPPGLSFIVTSTYSDLNKEFGFFSVPIKYRKYGVRFEVEMALPCDFGFKMQTGIVDLIQTVSFNDLTCQAQGLQCDCHATSDSCYTPGVTTNTCDIGYGLFSCEKKRQVIRLFTDQYEKIADRIGLNLKNFSKRTIEDLQLSLYWRRPVAVNQQREDWPYFIIMPFAAFEAILPISDKRDSLHPFSLSGGNNGHTGIGFSAGLNLDFVEVLEFGFQTSLTAFNKQCYIDMPVPTNPLQTGFLPYKADLTMKPGTNWTLSGLINAHHFLDQLSCYVQYVAIGHNANHFSNVCMKKFDPTDETEIIPDPLLDKMADESQWNAQVINVGLTYDISPNIALGFLWQAPVSQKNAYRSTTVLGSLIVTM